MKVEILNRYTPDGAEFYEWLLWDGPDGIEEVRGYATDLIVAFSKILEWRERIAAAYSTDLKTYLANNETDTEPTD